MHVLRVMMALLALTTVLWAQGTRVRDTVFDARGNRADGACDVRWGPFIAPDGTAVGAGRQSVRVRNGILDVTLVPTVGSSPSGTFYAVRCIFLGSVPGPVERWKVPVGGGSVSLTQVRVSEALPVPGAAVNVADVAGLDELLADLPRKGPLWLPLRAAIIDMHGNLGGASGALSDCVRVDGSAGPCGDGGGGTPGAPGSYAANVRPVKLSPLAWRLPQAPSPASSTACWANGVRWTYGVDYMIDGDLIEVDAAHQALMFTDTVNDPVVFTCDYWRD